jgi:hypothetical protein
MGSSELRADAEGALSKNRTLRFLKLAGCKCVPFIPPFILRLFLVYSSASQQEKKTRESQPHAVGQ